MAIVTPDVAGNGLAQFGKLSDGSGQTVQVTESSSVDVSRVWLRIEGPPTLQDPRGDDVAAHLSLEGVEVLRDQLTWLLEHHFHREGAKVLPNPHQVSLDNG